MWALKRQPKYFPAYVFNVASGHALCSKLACTIFKVGKHNVPSWHGLCSKWHAQCSKWACTMFQVNLRIVQRTQWHAQFSKLACTLFQVACTVFQMGMRNVPSWHALCSKQHAL